MRLPNIVTVTHVSPTGETFHLITKNIRTNAGALLIAQAQGQAAQSPSNYIACSALTIVPSIGDLSLPGEITINGLARQISAFGGYIAPLILDGAASYVLSTTFTATSPQVVNSIGCFNASANGVLLAELNIATQNLVAQSTLQIAWTFNV